MMHILPREEDSPRGGFPHESQIYARIELRGNERLEPVFVFGGCVVSPCARSLFRDGRKVKIGNRAFDLLVVLLKSAGSVVSKGDIFDYVWPAVVVEDSNLRVQMSNLKKALGPYAGAIINISGRGYVFAAQIKISWPGSGAH